MDVVGINLITVSHRAAVTAFISELGAPLRIVGILLKSIVYSCVVIYALSPPFVAEMLPDSIHLIVLLDKSSGLGVISAV